MKCNYVNRTALIEFLARLGADFARPSRLYLVGETTLVYEGWREHAARLEFTAEVVPADRATFGEVVHRLQGAMGMEVFEESPADVIPLPAGHEGRARPAGTFGGLRVYHFDPYSVAFRLIARGDEPDYHAVLAYLQHGWVTLEAMNGQLVDLLPQFTNETIQQDPAEFRRKFKGLLQMWRAAQLETSH